LVTSKFRDGEIGCTVLANTFFFEESAWIKEPPGFAPNIVRGKMYDSTVGAGRELWNGVQLSLSSHQFESPQSVEPVAIAEQTDKYGTPTLVRPRIGQASFRVLVTEAYQRRCAITGETTLMALEAAHIVPYSGEGSHEVSNGLLLRADFHRLFDVGLVSVTPDLRVKISPRIREEWFNGKAYYRLDDIPLSVVPLHPSLRPDPDRLKWHFQNRFQA
jgi:putative restriction endonuclease